MNRLIATLLMALAIGAAYADEPPVFDTPDQQAQFNRLIEELRCPKCQNQTLADSNAPLAIDLRRQIAAMVQEGRSDQEIKDYLVARYNDFVLYKPPLQSNTALLWAGPFLLILVGTAAVIIAVRRQARIGEDDTE